MCQACSFGPALPSLAGTVYSLQTCIAFFIIANWHADVHPYVYTQCNAALPASMWARGLRAVACGNRIGNALRFKYREIEVGHADEIAYPSEAPACSLQQIKP
eukprot:1158815-Pelagomonas_calceolata.AAC.13